MRNQLSAHTDYKSIREQHLEEILDFGLLREAESYANGFSIFNPKSKKVFSIVPQIPYQNQAISVGN
jgi:hypothetical protein